jgi:hypothetical protein
MTDLRQHRDLRAGNLCDELPGLLGVADLVLVALQRNPRIAHARRWAVHEADFRARVVFESLAPAHRFAQPEIGAEAERHRMNVPPGDCERRIHDGG